MKNLQSKKYVYFFMKLNLSDIFTKARIIRINEKEKTYIGSAAGSGVKSG